MPSPLVSAGTPVMDTSGNQVNVPTGRYSNSTRTTSLVVGSPSPSVKHAEMSTALSTGTNAPSDGS